MSEKADTGRRARSQPQKVRAAPSPAVIGPAELAEILETATQQPVDVRRTELKKRSQKTKSDEGRAGKKPFVLKVVKGTKLTDSTKVALRRHYGKDVVFEYVEREGLKSWEIPSKLAFNRQGNADRIIDAASEELERLGAPSSLALGLKKILDEFEEKLSTAPINPKLRPHIPVLLARAAALAFRQEASATASDAPTLSEPDGAITPYLGKRRSGPIDEFLRAAYPHRPGSPPLTLQYLRAHDPKAVGAINRLDPAKRESLGIRTEKEVGDELLASKNVDLSTQQGVEEARRLRSVIQSRLQQLKP